MTVSQAILTLAAFLCSLVAGFLFAFAVVVTPGIRGLDDAGFLPAFQVIDRVIQNNQPLFIPVRVGSVLALGAAAVLGLWYPGRTELRGWGPLEDQQLAGLLMWVPMGVVYLGASLLLAARFVAPREEWRGTAALAAPRSRDR
jgi:hypothetical protein